MIASPSQIPGKWLWRSYFGLDLNTVHIKGEKRMSTVVQEAPPRGNNPAAAGGSIQLVSFRLGQEEYGIEITHVREIILMGVITRVPQTPAYVKGLINLRSTVIPVIDLRIRFGLPEGETTDASRIMVVNQSAERRSGSWSMP